MSRSIIGVTAVALCLASVVLVLSITTAKSPAVACPKCGVTIDETDIRMADDGTRYFCRRCLHVHSGPVRSDFSWLNAVEEWWFSKPPIAY